MKLTRTLGGMMAAFSALAALAIFPLAARADSGLPASTVVVDCTADDGSHVGGGSSCAVDHSTAAATTSPFVSLTASAAYTAAAPASSGGFVVLNYNFAVIGGTQDTVVPVDIDVLLQQVTVNSANSPAYGFSEVNVNTPRSATSVAICSSGCNNASNSFSGTLQVNALAGETGGNVISLEIEALAAGYADIPPNSATASADPRIYVDPGFANAASYSIVLSDGVGNGIAPVPEPGTPGLMLGGLVFIGLGLGRLRPRR